MKFLLLITCLALSGCSESTITGGFSKSISEEVPKEALQYVEEKYALLDARPLTETTDGFVFRLLGYGGFSGHPYTTEMRELSDESALVTYKRHDLKKISVERKENSLLLRMLNERLRLSSILEWPVFWKESESVIDDGMYYVIEVYSKGEHHVVFRSTHDILEPEPDTAFVSLLEGLREYEK